MSTQGRSDARNAAWLLAVTAKDCLADPEKARRSAIALNNVYRLIESYRVNPFFGLEVTSEPQQSSQTISPLPPLEHHVKAVRDALEYARTIAFPGQTIDQAVTVIERVLKGVAYPESGEPSNAERDLTTHFFSEVVQRL